MPGLKDFKRIIQEEYVIHKNDCSNKVGEYVRSVRAQGGYAEAWVVKIPTEKEEHAVAMIIYQGTIMFVDPVVKKCYPELPKDWTLDCKVSDEELYHGQEWIKDHSYDLRN